MITGDKTQIDLRPRAGSGLLEIESVLRDIEGIGFIYLDETDVVRHALVKDIIRAYRERTSPVTMHEVDGRAAGATDVRGVEHGGVEHGGAEHAGNEDS